MADRSALHAYVSEECHSNWHGFAASQGVSVSALLEQIGLELQPDGDLSLPALDLGVCVQAARKIDAARRRRLR